MCFSLRIYIRETQIVYDLEHLKVDRFFVALSLEMKYFSRLVVVWYHLALVFTASLFEVENGVNPCRVCKTFWGIQNKLICCIEDFKVFAGNWTLVLCERIQSLSRKIF